MQLICEHGSFQLFLLIVPDLAWKAPLLTSSTACSSILPFSCTTCPTGGISPQRGNNSVCKKQWEGVDANCIAITQIYSHLSPVPCGRRAHSCIHVQTEWRHIQLGENASIQKIPTAKENKKAQMATYERSSLLEFGGGSLSPVLGASPSCPSTNASKPLGPNATLPVPLANGRSSKSKTLTKKPQAALTVGASGNFKEITPRGKATLQDSANTIQSFPQEWGRKGAFPSPSTRTLHGASAGLIWGVFLHQTCRLLSYIWTFKKQCLIWLYQLSQLHQGSSIFG